MTNYRQVDLKSAYLPNKATHQQTSIYIKIFTLAALFIISAYLFWTRVENAKISVLKYQLLPPHSYIIWSTKYSSYINYGLF